MASSIRWPSHASVPPGRENRDSEGSGPRWLGRGTGARGAAGRGAAGREASDGSAPDRGGPLEFRNPQLQGRQPLQDLFVATRGLDLRRGGTTATRNAITIAIPTIAAASTRGNQMFTSNAAVAMKGAATRDTPPKVCATPMTVPVSSRSAPRVMRAVVDGNSSAVPIGTSGMISAEARSTSEGIEQQANDQQHRTNAHGPRLADPVDDGTEEDGAHHDRESADVEEPGTDGHGVHVEARPEEEREDRGEGSEREHADAVDPHQPGHLLRRVPEHLPGRLPDRPPDDGGAPPVHVRFRQQLQAKPKFRCRVPRRRTPAWRGHRGPRPSQ